MGHFNSKVNARVHVDLKKKKPNNPYVYSSKKIYDPEILEVTD